jgi:multiple sugar transport system substrate-binding protein
MRKLFAWGLIASMLITLGLGCNASTKTKPASASPITLNVWGVFDDEYPYDGSIKAFQGLHPNISVNYRKFRIDEYENEILNAFAEDRGPDIFMLHNTWIHAYEPKIKPAPATLTTAYREVQGLNKQVVWTEKAEAGLSVPQLKTRFIDQVAHDVVLNAPIDGKEGTDADQIFGLPLAVDTMGLYYNKDVLNAAGIPTAASSWSELQDHVKRITKYDDQGKLVRPAVGLGTAKNVNRSFDILSLLMMQNGAQMADENGVPTFQRMPANMTRDIPPGQEALTFYTDFANPTKDVFTWDDTQPNSLDAFIAGKTAYYFGYAYDLPTIRSQAPKLNFGITTVPQIDPGNQVNYANYWLLTVAKKTKHTDVSWALIEFMASETQAKSYLTKTAKPTALRSIIPTQVSDGDLAPFVTELLTAKSWYHGSNIVATEAAFADMIASTLGGAEPQKALNLASDTIAQTVR